MSTTACASRTTTSSVSSRYALIVDDDPGILDAYEMALAELGFVPILVSDSQAAVTKAQEFPPSLIILDQRMPGLTGAELAQQLRDCSFGSVPIIMVSAGRNIESCAREAGATAWLKKPFDIEDLIQIILDHSRDCEALVG